MAWRTANTLLKLRDQINGIAPKRNKASDGFIGNAEHAARSSDHNPWVKDSRGIGVVTAGDFTNDPAHGFDCNIYAKRLADSNDPRIKYIIWNRQIWSRKYNPKGAWRKYTGANPHTKHMHISVEPNQMLYDSTKTWPLVLPPKPLEEIAHAIMEDGMTYFVQELGKGPVYATNFVHKRHVTNPAEREMIRKVLAANGQKYVEVNVPKGSLSQIPSVG